MSSLKVEGFGLQCYVCQASIVAPYTVKHYASDGTIGGHYDVPFGWAEIYEPQGCYYELCPEHNLEYKAGRLELK